MRRRSLWTAQSVSQRYRLGAANLHLVRRRSSLSEPPVDVSDERVELVETGDDRGNELRAVDEGDQPGEPRGRRTPAQSVS